ncbi:MAG TPA: glycosyltransferase [Blastocatellia bacterium]|nr:glycosyltransferase [Blastocatellia bacterium]
MSERPDISAVISTYNRSGMLRVALERLLEQQAEGVRYEVIVVDNNSTDRTREVVESFVSDGRANLRYVFEPKQGVSYARNSGIQCARSPIIAFADDDVVVARDWVAVVKREFDAHPEVDCLGGKVLAEWQSEPPAWLTRDHWSPLALQDYGDEPFLVNVKNPLCLVSANLAFRREVFAAIGPFAPELQRVKDGIGSMEDLELLIRYWRAGGESLYLPSLVVTAEVPVARTTKEYHRRWHRGHGSFYALMRSPELERSSKRALFGVPAHLYRQCVIDAANWGMSLLKAEPDRAFLCETRLRFFAGFFKQRKRDYMSSRQHGAVREVAEFVHSMW